MQDLVHFKTKTVNNSLLPNITEAQKNKPLSLNLSLEVKPANLSLKAVSRSLYACKPLPSTISNLNLPNPNPNLHVNHQQYPKPSPKPQIPCILLFACPVHLYGLVQPTLRVP